MSLLERTRIFIKAQWNRRIVRSLVTVLAVLVLVGIGLRIAAEWGDTRIGYALHPGKGPDPAPGSRRLVVLIHGLGGNDDRLRGVAGLIASTWPAADLMHVTYEATWLTNADPLDLARQMQGHIARVATEQQEAGRPYDDIVLVGHSMGTLLARKALVLGHDVMVDQPHLPAAQPQPWATRVQRVILLAGMNRGWSMDPPLPEHRSPWQSLRFRVASWIGFLTGSGRLLHEMERGSRFVANLRVQWIDLGRRLREREGREPTTVQLLGDIDEVVSSEDSADIGAASNAIYIPVFSTGHRSILDLDDPEHGSGRRVKIAEALTEPIGELLRRYPSSGFQTQIDRRVKLVVFIMHGIRDMAEWSAKFDAPIKQAFAARYPDSDKTVIIEPPGYDYFPMGSFLLFGDRQRNVRWFMDRYTETRAMYPDAEIGFIGHSNGSYVLASAMQHYQTLRVGRVVFAGSVVPRDYPWDKLHKAGRIDRIRNYMASGDWVVGIFPRVFEVLRSVGIGFWNRDLGSGGFNGFNDGTAKRDQVFYVPGGHSTALEDDYRKAMASFIVGDQVERGAVGPMIDGKCGMVAFLSNFCWLVWLGLIVLLGWSWWAGGPRLLRRWTPRAWPVTAFRWGFPLFILFLLQTL